jgi:hypothetical protein
MHLALSRGQHPPTFLARVGAQAQISFGPHTMITIDWELKARNYLICFGSSESHRCLGPMKNCPHVVPLAINVQTTYSKSGNTSVLSRLKKIREQTDDVTCLFQLILSFLVVHGLDQLLQLRKIKTK